jgi:hypothetical protein
MGKIIPNIWEKTTSESYFHMISGQNDLLLTMDMAKVGGPLSVVKAFPFMLCANIRYRQVGGLLLDEGFHTNSNIPSPFPATFAFR